MNISEAKETVKKILVQSKARNKEYSELLSIEEEQALDTLLNYCDELEDTVKKQSHSAQFRRVEGLQKKVAELEDRNIQLNDYLITARQEKVTLEEENAVCRALGKAKKDKFEAQGKPKEITVEDDAIIQQALDVGFMISSNYGQEEPKLMPTSDMKTLIRFAQAIHKLIREGKE